LPPCSFDTNRRRHGVVRTAVVGVGNFGRRHAAKHAAAAGIELVALADIDAGRAAEAAAETGALAVTDYRDLVGGVDAVSIVVPTADHYEIARFFLDHGVHVLVEKPITRALTEADDLIRRAGANRLVLQVGHLERFFTAEIGLDAAVRQPLYIESQRIAPFGPRGTDVSVVLDLMIHDIDLIGSLVRQPIEQVDAIGAPVLSAEPDIVNTRLKFSGGCVASIVASRIAFKRERRLRIFQPDSMISVDLLERHVVTVRRASGNRTPDAPAAWTSGFTVEERDYAAGDPLGAEIAAFAQAAATGSKPVVTGEDGRRALDVAIRIGDSLQAHLALMNARIAENGGAAARVEAGLRR
jgi:predicted dehydrogenase